MSPTKQILEQQVVELQDTLQEAKDLIDAALGEGEAGTGDDLDEISSVIADDSLTPSEKVDQISDIINEATETEEDESSD